MSASRLPRSRRGVVVLATAATLAAVGLAAVSRPAAAATDPATTVRVNQAGYAPGLPKQATAVSTATSPLSWSLKNSAGTTVASGQTVVRGYDALSGDSVHTVDFSSYDTTGTGYVLSVAGVGSYPFDITASHLSSLRRDALAFFYHQRSGTPILAQYVGAAYARPAGHVNVAPNQGDNAVPCRVSCGYTQDVRGGWYDAGDQGKYAVNGGIAAWQLQNEYERSRYVAGAAPLGDGDLAIPERANGVPDVLDEARWEVEFLLKMQVPDGRTDAGMARLKVSDENWTALPTRPEQDSQRRVLSAVSTAATLNLAAVAAQCVRVWKNLDATFAARCLTAARKAYTAAKANPTRYADANDSNGSGTYVDNNVTDEFYWAAAELYTTTAEAAYRTDVTGSSLFRGASFNTQGFDWWWTAGLGDATLAVVPNGLGSSDVTAIRQAFTAYADKLINNSATLGYPAPTLNYNWGSNGNVANNANVLAMAYDFTGQAKYRNGAFQALDYFLGRNPLNRSLIAGYGDVAPVNVHHRFFAHSLDGSLPIAPPGAIVGGPNPGLEDPVAKAQLAGCKPQKCYLDDIQAYSVNEVAINWNSALAWLANWAAEKAGSGSPDPTPSPTVSPTVTPTTSPTVSPTSPTVPPSPTSSPAPSAGGCRVTYSANAWNSGFTAAITITNLGAGAWNGWTLKFTLPATAQISQGWSGTFTQSGTAVTVTSATWNGAIAAGGSTSIGFNATTSAPTANPTSFTVNGTVCGTS